MVYWSSSENKFCWEQSNRESREKKFMFLERRWSNWNTLVIGLITHIFFTVEYCQKLGLWLLLSLVLILILICYLIFLNSCEDMNTAFIHVPLMFHWRSVGGIVLTKWKKTKGCKMSSLIKHFFDCYKKDIHNKLNHRKWSQNLISGFAKTGLYPFDPPRPKQRLPSEKIPNDLYSLLSVSSW